MSAEKRDHCPVGDDAAIEAAAVSWLCERDDGFAPERATAFAVWCAADPRHRAAVAKRNAFAVARRSRHWARRSRR